MDETTTTLGFADIFKKKVLEGFSLNEQNLTVPNVILTLGIAFLVGLFIYLIYRKTFKGVLYSHSFNISLVMLTMVTTAIIMSIASAPALSLGMVGALSIVRFRTAVKDPQDTVYMFWSIAEGIALGANFMLYAVISALIIGVALFVLSLLQGRGTQNFLLVVHYSESCGREVNAFVDKLPNARLKSRTVTHNGTEATWEIRLPSSRNNLTANLMAIYGVSDATLVAYQNEIA